MRKLSTVLLILLLLILSGCSNNSASDLPGGNLTVTYIDVGQGDSILIQAPQGKTVLIDGGPKDSADTLLKTLSQKGVKGIDVVIATHEDSDHIGSLDDVIKAYPVRKVFLPKMPTKATRAVKDFLTALKNKNLKLSQAKAGVELDLGSDVSAILVGPVKESYDKDNNYSAVLKLTYGEISFLFTGDAEKEAEADMAAGRLNIRADVLKIGHHGSKNSSSEEFLAAVKPRYAVIEVGKDNSYGHPTQTALNRLKKRGVMVYRTDLNGTVTAVTDGKEVRFSTER